MDKWVVEIHLRGEDTYSRTLNSLEGVRDYIKEETKSWRGGFVYDIIKNGQRGVAYYIGL